MTDQEMQHPNRPEQEHFEENVYGSGERMPIFNLSGAKIKPGSEAQTYLAGCILRTGVLPDIPITVMLGFPVYQGHVNFHNNPHKLRVECDLASFSGKGLVTRVEEEPGLSFGPHEPYLYIYNQEVQKKLAGVKLRIYDGEDGKIYESLPLQCEIEHGKLIFEDRFYEVAINEKGEVVMRADTRKALGYTLEGKTGVENTEAKFILEDEKK